METKREAIKFLNEMRDRFIDEKNHKSSSDLKVISAIGLVCGMAEDSISSKWISVDDRLPEDNIQVLCYCPDRFLGKIFVDESVRYDCESRGYKVSDGDYVFCSNTDYFGDDCITHWQPLPDVPEV